MSDILKTAAAYCKNLQRTTPASHGGTDALRPVRCHQWQVTSHKVHTDQGIKMSITAMSNEQLALILKFVQDHGVSKEQLIAAVTAWWQVTDKQGGSK